MNISKRLDKYLNERKVDKFEIEGFEINKNRRYTHPDYPGYEIQLDDRNRIKITSH